MEELGFLEKMCHKVDLSTLLSCIFEGIHNRKKLTTLNYITLFLLPNIFSTYGWFKKALWGRLKDMFIYRKTEVEG